MRDARCEISRGIDGVACGAAEGEADGENQQSYGDESDTAESDGDIFISWSRGDMEGELGAGDKEDGEDEGVSTQGFAKESLFEVSDIGGCAEAGQFKVSFRCCVEVVAVERVDEAGAGEGSCHLGEKVAGQGGCGQLFCGRHGYGDRWVEVCTAEGGGAEGPDEDGEAPAGSDDDPSSAVAFGFGEDDVGDHAISEEDQQGGTDEFSEEGIHGVSFGCVSAYALGCSHSRARWRA